MKKSPRRKFRVPAYRFLAKKMQGIVDRWPKAAAIWKIPKRVSVQRARYRLHAFVMGRMAPPPPRGKTWHTRLNKNRTGIEVFLGKKPNRKKRRRKS